MPIRPFLAGELFDPELMEPMSQALAEACAALGLKEKEDAAVRLLAMRIIDRARAGVRDRALLTTAALEGLEHDPENACPGLDPGWTPVFGKDHARS